MKLFRKRSDNISTKGLKRRGQQNIQFQRPVFQLPTNSDDMPWDDATLDDRSIYTSPRTIERTSPDVGQNKTLSSPSVEPIARENNNNMSEVDDVEVEGEKRGKRFPWTVVSEENSELPPPPPPDSSPSVYSSASAALASLFTPPDERQEDRDDESSQKSSSSSSIDFDLGSRLNLSDAELMGHNSPGRMRLTEDGLKRHERKAFKELLEREEKLRRPGFIGWKLQRETRLYFRDQLAERDAQLQEKIEKQQKQKRSLSTRTASGSKLWVVPESFEQASSSPLVLGRQTRKQPPSKNVDMSDLSVAPLDVFSDVLSSNKRSPSVDLRQEAILRKERERQKEAERVKRQQQAREHARIEKMRRAAVERQRILNSKPPKHKKQHFAQRHSFEQSEMSKQTNSTDEGVECIVTIDEKKPVIAQTTVSSKESGGLSSCETTAASSLSSMPCAVCSSGDREFIAVPCMHYCFCKDCVDERLREEGICPVCQTSDVTFFLVRG